MLQAPMQDESLTAMPLAAMCSGEGRLPRRSVRDGRSFDLADPAVHALTDFSHEHPATVDPERTIDDALADMIQLGVRALLAVKEQRVLGLVTSYDIQGEKPIQFLQSSNYSRHQDIRVAHVMTPWERLPALDWSRIEHACAGDLLRVFERTGASHLLVIEADAKRSACVVRALASRARLMRQLKSSRRTG